MLSVTPILLLGAGGFADLAGFSIYAGDRYVWDTNYAVNLWIFAAIFLMGAAITNTLNRLTCLGG